MLLGLWMGPGSTTKLHLCSVSCTGYRCPSASFSNCWRSPTRPCTGRSPCPCVSLLSATDLDAHSALQTTHFPGWAHELAARTGIAVSPSPVPPCGMATSQYGRSGVNALFQEAIKDFTLWAHIWTVMWTFSWVDWMLETYILSTSNTAGF